MFGLLLVIMQSEPATWQHEACTTLLQHWHAALETSSHTETEGNRHCDPQHGPRIRSQQLKVAHADVLTVTFQPAFCHVTQASSCLRGGCGACALFPSLTSSLTQLLM